jgi:hypothetical protein
MFNILDFLKQFGLGVPELISSVSALIAFLSAIYSGLQGNRAHKLALVQEARRKPLIECQYLQAKRQRLNDAVAVGFLVTIDNRSELSNSIRKSRLQANYALQDGALVVPMTAELKPTDNQAVLSYFTPHLELPLRLKSYESYRGWVVFTAKAELGDRVASAQRYKVILEDEFDKEIEFEAGLIGDWSDVPS